MIYEAKCKYCGKISEYSATVDNRLDTPVCCTAKMTKIITLNYRIGRQPDFVTDNISGEPIRIHSFQQMEKLCTEHCVTPKPNKGWQ